MPDLRDPGQVPAGYPRVDYAPTFLTEPQEASWAYAVDQPGLILDYEPRAHDVADPDVYQSAPGLASPELSPEASAHLIDRGAVSRQYYAPAIGRANDEQYRTDRWEQGEVSTGSVDATLRGANSLPINNPDGFRIGWSVKRFMHREMPHEQMEHTERVMHPLMAAKAVESPAMTAAQSNRYTSPFPWRSFYGARAQQFPLLRRQPPEAYDVDQTNDGINQPSDIVGDWVVG